MADKIAPPQDDEFVTVSDPTSAAPETKIVFDMIGDQFTGIYLGMREQSNSDGSYKQARFQAENGDEIYFTNANYSLKEGLKTVRNGSKVRITYADDLDTGQASPMRVFKVEVARRNSAVRRA